MTSMDGPAALEFIRQQLIKNPEISYREVSEAAIQRGIKIYPIMYGRAKALEGLVNVSARGSGKTAKAKAETSESRFEISAGSSSAGSSSGGSEVDADTAPRKRGRPRKHPVATSGTPSSLSAIAGIGGLVEAVKINAQERERYRRALEQIRSILEGALA